MKLGIISDTHIPSRLICLPKKVYSVFSDVNYILHAGDIEEPSVLSELERIAPVFAVAGNMDVLLSYLPTKREMDFNGLSTGIIHGSGMLRSQIRNMLREEFEQAKLIIYGHTHQAFWGKEGDKYYMNPGSTVGSSSSEKPSVGIVFFKQGSLKGEIISL